MQNSSQENHRLAGYETRDVHTRGLVIFGIGLAVTVAVVMVIAVGLFHYFGKSQSLGPPVSPFANARELPPTPRLQVRPQQDLRSLRQAAQTRLGSYGWVDQQKGIVHIPIDRAMDLLLQRGLPVSNEGQKSEAFNRQQSSQ